QPVVERISLGADRIFLQRMVIEKDIRSVHADIKQLPVILDRALERARQSADHFFAEFIMCVCCRHVDSSFLLPLQDNGAVFLSSIYYHISPVKNPEIQIA